MPRAVCAGCDVPVPAGEKLPFACAGARPDDDVDHVLRFDVPHGDFPVDKRCNHPFLRFRRHLWIWHAAQHLGCSDRDYCDLVRRLDARIAGVDGHGFSVTPYGYSTELSAYYKDETGNVAGSHKARHLMGIALYLDVLELERVAPWTQSPPLAIASCGNAALAAAVLARAARRHLEVFIPPAAHPRTVGRLRDLGCDTIVCERGDDDAPGDPCYRRFKAAVSAGALPFCCQGPDNGLTIDGGRTLALEMIEQHRALGAPSLARLFLQVGGGALASATWQAYAHAHAGGAIATLPAFTAVQTHGGHPLVRAWRKLNEGTGPRESRLEHARRHRSHYMWPWEKEPASIAGGILDDETYDWWQVLRGVTQSGGDAMLASEQHLADARELAAGIGVPASATGAAGYAGLLGLLARGRQVESAAVIFSGVQR